MKTTKWAVALLAATGLCAIATPVMAYEAGDWLVRGRIAHIATQDSSDDLILNPGGSIGEGIKTDSDTIPEIDITYMMSPNWGIELILGYSEHTVTTEKAAGVVVGGIGGSKDVIESKVLPPTLLLQYHFAPHSNIRPYVGAGINYTYFFDEKVPSRSSLSAPGDNVNLDSSWGFAVQAGVDVAINDDWFVNADVKYIDMDTEGHFSNTVAGDAKIKTDLNPIVWGIGIGRRF